MGDFAAA
jgi:hypothetical protein